MSKEDQTAEKLKGCNCFIKFTDGEELYLNIEELEYEEGEIEWFEDTDRFLNSADDNGVSRIPGLAVNRKFIKYIKNL